MYKVMHFWDNACLIYYWVYQPDRKSLIYYQQLLMHEIISETDKSLICIFKLLEAPLFLKKLQLSLICI